MSASLRPVSGTPQDVRDLLDPWVRAGGPPIHVRTSGSTGQPKDVVLSHEAVLASAQASIERLGGPGQWLLDLPVDGIAGVQVLVRSILAGTTPVVAAGHDSLEAALGAFGAGPRFASLVPTQVVRLARTNGLAQLAAFDAVLVGGAALDPEVGELAGAAGVRLVRTYGMTETCGGCVYDGIPLAGVEVRIGDPADDPAGDLADDTSGQIWLDGPVLFDGYVGEPRQPGWFATADRGRLDPDGTLRVLGRSDDTVVSGGVNIALPAVEQALRRLPDVLDASVVGVPDAEWGTRVVAAVVVRPGATTSVSGVRDRLEAAGLPRWWAPRELLVLAELPRLPAGKVDAEQVRALAADRSAST